ncbi:MAG: methionyl aminopeptidase [Lachnospiraceae bacterium]|nr:methionyl aminopeptidase [Lachnospiraceae bacterium]
MKIGPNSPCWCKSKKKYKVCHMQFDERLKGFSKNPKIELPPREIIKNDKQIAGIKKAAKVNNLVLDEVSKMVKEGITTAEIDLLVYKLITDNGGIPATLGYYGYPKSVCTSVNEQVCHGIPDDKTVLKSGDIINVDVTTILDGFYADASRMFMIGDVAEETRKLVEVTKEAREVGFKAIKPWETCVGDIGYAISEYVKPFGYSIIRDIGGHGVGIDFHEDPYVCHIGQPMTGMLLVPGMVFTIEPMINMGKEDFYEDESNGWTIYTEDKKPSAQWEYTVLVTEEGAEIIAY